MRIKSLLVGLLLVMTGVTVRGQIHEVYYQGFESDEEVRFSVNPSANMSYATDLVASGAYSLKLTQSSTVDIEVLSDTIDLSDPSTVLSYVALEFDHINNIKVNGAVPDISKIYVKRIDQTSWTQLTQVQYNRTGTYSTAFVSTGTFNENSYTEWKRSTMTDEYWRSERFDLNNLISSTVPNDNRKLLVKLELKKRTIAADAAEAWWIDNMRVRASNNAMVKPKITMVRYPDGGAFPNSRRAVIMLDASTTVAQGICDDSVSLFYKVGSDPTVTKLTMTPVAGVADRYQAVIPFFGYDTLMQFYCIVKDATTNNNEVTFPAAANSWVRFWYTRGVDQLGVPTPGFTGTTSSNLFPFQSFSDGRSEWVFDSTLMADAGYGPGAITDLRFTVHSAVTTEQVRPYFQFRMRNAPASYVVPAGQATIYFSTDMHTVYDSTLVVPVTPQDSSFTIHLKDTFYYAGGDLVMQALYNGTEDPPATNLKMITCETAKQSFYKYDMGSGMGTSPYTDPAFRWTDAAYVLTKRPAIVMTQHKNQPLLFDMGVSKMEFPTYEVPIMDQPSHLDVTLRNFGALPVNAIRITYTIDDTIHGYYDWSGTMNGGDSAMVTITNNVVLPAGYHYVRVWVQDTLTASGAQYRDHEPLNDTAYTSFIVCYGPLNGVKTIGPSTAADYNTIEEFLFSLSRCGIDDSLIVKIEDGNWPAFVLPEVNGISAANYIVFESADTARATIYADSTTADNFIVNLNAQPYIRFRNLDFERREDTLSTMIGLGATSVGCHFEGCRFIDLVENPTVAIRIPALLTNNNADSMVVDGCTFEGGVIGVSLVGPSSNDRRGGSVVSNNVFRNQINNAVSAQFQTNLSIDHNEMYDVVDNQNNVVQVIDCDGDVDIVANKVYTTHGAGCIGVSGIVGTSTNHAIIANNMFVCDDDGTANLLRTPVNIISADWTDVVYNSVKMTAQSRNNTAAVNFGGSTLTNSRFVNNIVACMDSKNYALCYIPGASTTNTVSNNVYYASGVTLNKLASVAYNNLDTWSVAVPQDSNSMKTDPIFLNGSKVDLRTFKRVIKGIGIPLAEVTVDMFDTVRNDTATCPGAFEFSALLFDFEPEALVSPEADNCAMPDSVQLAVRIRNNGINQLTVGGNDTLKLAYSVNGDSVQIANIPVLIPAEDTVTFNTGVFLQMPPDSIYDATYTVKMWTIFPGDPNQTNDTAQFSVISRFHSAAPSDTVKYVNYLTEATVTVLNGVEQWKVYGSDDAPKEPSTLYWYYNSDDTEPFLEGFTLTTDTLRSDTAFYVRQHRKLPIVRMTQVMVKNDGVQGVGSLPDWMNSQTQFAVQITNVGDAPASLLGDTLRSISPTSGFNNRLCKFGDITLQPGQSIVAQFVSGNTPALSADKTIYSGIKIAPQITNDIGLVYRHNGVVIDAVALNSVTTATSTQSVKWSTQNVPSYVWDGDGVAPSSTNGGLIRVAFNGNASDWAFATSAKPLQIASTDPSWIRYVDNGCLGEPATVSVVIANPPTNDIHLTPVAMPSGCDLGEQNLSVGVHNYGDSTVHNLELSYLFGGDTITDTLTFPIVGHVDTVYTFAEPVNLHFATDSVVTFKIWASQIEGDPVRRNDTTSVTTTSLFTLDAPVVMAPDTCEYGTSDTLSIVTPENALPVWYDYNLNPVDTAMTHVTELLYSDGELGVSYIVAIPASGQIGTGVTKIAKTSYPSPYQPNNRFAKQQYIYSASELHALGLDKGYINRMAFYFDSLYGAADSLIFDKYVISMGTCADSIFANNSDWLQANVMVFDRDSMVLHRSQSHDWVWHDFDRNFNWDGVSNVVVQIVFEDSVRYTTGVQTTYTNKANTTLVKVANDPLVPTTADYAEVGTKGNSRPNIMFEGAKFGCTGPITPIEVVVANIPPIDGSILWPAGFDATSYSTCTNVSPLINVRNLGNDTIESFSLVYSIDGGDIVDTTTVDTIILSGTTLTVPLFSRELTPGRHSLDVALAIDGDNVASNDSVKGNIIVRFCNGTYTIGPDSTADFHSIKAAVDTLNVVGIVGPVAFNVAAGEYNERVELHAVYGSSETNSVTFSGPADSTVAKLTGVTGADSNFVFHLDGVSNITIENISMASTTTSSTVKYANVLVIDGGSNITLRNNSFKVPGHIYNSDASCIVMNGVLSDVLMENNRTDSGYYAIVHLEEIDQKCTNFTINDNRLVDFQARGIDIQGVTNAEVRQNQLHAGAAAASRGMIGINMLNVDGVVSIEKNKVYLVDEQNGSKRGIHLTDVSGTDENRVMVANNMSSVSGTGKVGLTPVHPSGIYIDGASSYINVFYNSVRVYAGVSQNDTRAFFAGAATTNLQVVNNIFANFSKSHAYYVTTASSVPLSNNNGYYTEGAKFAYWGAERASLTALQTANGQDQNSVIDEPFYTAVDDLHLLMTNYCAKGQSRPEVTDDIDGRPRALVGGSTLGAHEMSILNHNMTIVRIIEPIVPKTPADIESDPVRVIVQFYNNSPSVEENVSWYAYIEGHKDQTMSPIRNIGPFSATQLKTDTVMMPTVLGIIDSQTVRVVLVSEVDDDTTDNQLTAKLYLAPAYNVRAVKVSTTGSGCSLTNAPISINIKNVGSKDIPAGTQLQIGYRAQAYFPSYISNHPDSNKINIPTMPSIVEETKTLTSNLAKNGSVTLNFTDNANLYPTGMSENIKVRLSGWVKLDYDIITDNDTTDNSSTSSPVVDAYYTPAAPVGNDTTLPYGTWGEVTASQENERPIRWYRDTTAAPFYSTTGANAYANSCVWSNTPAYFHDSTYYLRCYSDKNCPSNFSQVHVQVRQKYANDVALEAVLAPLGSRVYMENDTVRVRIANYGTTAKSNIPVTYQLRKGNNTNPIQEVTETCTTNIGAGQTYEYAFNTLVTFDQPTTGGTYQLRAWTDLENDQSRRNDTIRLKQQLRPADANNTLLDYTFTRLAESTYPSRSIATSEAINITRFTFNSIDLDIPPLGRSYINFGVFSNPEWPVLHVQRGAVDTALINIIDPTAPEELKRGKVAVYIDFNRNGSFTDTSDRVVYADNLWTDSTLVAPVTIPYESSLGYMKMRVVSSNFDVAPAPNLGADDGMVMDFLLFVDENLPNRDLAINNIVSPRNFEVNGDTIVVSFKVSNQGMIPIDSVEFSYVFEDDEPDSNDFGSFVWHGPLQPGASAVVSLPARVFPFGTSHLYISHDMPGDGNDANNLLEYEYHRLHIITLTMDDNFDSINYWYAPVGYNAYSHNYWEMGTPSKTRISGASSAPNAWVTDLDETIKSGRRGNVSYLYLPIINISSIKSDTLSFDLVRNMTGGSSCYLEYYNYENKWMRVQSDSAITNWYNDSEKNVFNGTSTGYAHYYFRTSFISGNFQERCRFRIVFTTPMGSNDNASFGEGCAIDNFHIGRARARMDVGVIEIIEPDHPSYGQTITPEVVVRNFGSDTIFNLSIGYTDPSNPLPSVSTFSCMLPPDDFDTFQMQHPFTVLADYPDTISIAAFTIMSADLYWDNDTTHKIVPISHLDYDISAVDVLRPLDLVIAGDSITVEVRVENFGNNAISRAYMSYSVNNGTYVNETVDFDAVLGRPLDPGEYFNYTFAQKYRASMGIMKLVAVASDDYNSYVYNDTVVKYFRGISSIMDLSAVAVVVDNISNSNSTSVQVVIENKGARGANDFEVGFFIDGHSYDSHVEVCHFHHPLAALSTGYYLFEYKLPYRATPYDSITAWVSIAEDNDVSNDTTNVIMPATMDLELVRIIVEENAEPDCHVYLEVRNVGNMVVNGKTIFMNATINSTPIAYSEPRRIDPNHTTLMMFNRRIPKDVNRHYVGSATITVQVDTNEVNNQTNNIVVVNYVEGAPTVEVSDVDLGQNYPNPFSTFTEVPISLNNAARVRFFVIDALGHMVEDREFQGEQGTNIVTVDMTGHSSGVYYYGIEVNGQRKMRKMILR